MGKSYFVRAVCSNCGDKSQEVEISFGEPSMNSNIINVEKGTECGIEALCVEQPYEN